MSLTRIWVMSVVAGIGVASSSGPALGSLPPSLPTGAVVPLELAGPLAVAPDGALYVVDQVRHEVLVRVPGGTFRVVAGDGKPGFAGNGGPATEAEISDVTALAFWPDGGLYLADGSRVRLIDAAGTISTVAGDGGSPEAIRSATPARQAALGSQLAIAFSPSGELYVATARQLLRLTSGGVFDTVRAVLRSGPVRGSLNSFGQLAFGRHGEIYASSGERGWSLYEITPAGVAVYRGYARGSGGALASIAATPARIVEAGNGSNLLALEGTRLATAYRFDHVPGTNWFTLTYFAFAPGGAIYADDIGSSGFQPYQQLVEVSHGRVRQLWRHRVRT